eukprot:TRINITY_DN6560_c0_g1_i1.p1 TRINITY_DN6560_c0_g1~~TRINITY_DN6560_c0_g1_i1.p1  ORF type:complete len:470 (+),score=73.16 TRINITY_DN6560_c0_g1_i1:142-1551(+)
MLLDTIPVAVDSFYHRERVLFFCSHAHEDHLKGLHDKWRKGPIHCSPATAKLLENRWPSLKVFLRPLALAPAVHHLQLETCEADAIADIATPTTSDVKVVLVDANHVPGAVMFIFSAANRTVILHTGDFRLHREHAHLATLPALQGGITRIYLDNTFCHPDFKHPPKEDAIEAAVRACAARWPCLAFVAVYKLGREYLLQTLAERLGCKALIAPARLHEMNLAAVPSDEAVRDQAGCPRTPTRAFEQQPASAKAVSVQELRRLSATGCIWALSGRELRPAVRRALDEGLPVLGLAPSGWCGAGRSPPHAEHLQNSQCVDASEDSADFLEDLVDEDGVQELEYSDHCSFLELVQFLSMLPAAPVTFLSPTPLAKRGRYDYDGEEGVRQLLELSEVPSIEYQVVDASRAGNETAGAAKRRRVARKGAARVHVLADAPRLATTSSSLVRRKPVQLRFQGSDVACAKEEIGSA